MTNNNREALGEATYRIGAIERLAEARLLLDSQQFAGSIYLAGRGVEGMLRSIIWRYDPDIRQGKIALETGHNLRALLDRVRKLGLLTPISRNDEFEASVQKASHEWHNDLRYYPGKLVERRWRRLGFVNKQTTLKRAAVEFFEACSAVIKRGEIL